ncbi:MAG: hypothetical protein WAK26_09070 [Terracidiphilus sp.]
MRIVTYAVSTLIAVFLFSAQGITQSVKEPGVSKEGNMCTPMVRLFQKGGVLAISEHLYVAVSSSSNDMNELILRTADWKEQIWKGKSVTKPEVVIVYEGRVYEDSGWLPPDLPDQFDLSNAVVISFEKNKVQIFDFQQMRGGYYERMPK